MRYRSYLIGQYQALTGYLGNILLFIGLTVLSPLLALPFYPQEIVYSYEFLIPGVPLVVIGWYLRRRYTPEEPIALTVQEGMVIVVVAWLAACTLGTLPLILGGHLGFNRAMFESVSGWTSTGLSVMDVNIQPKLVLLYRSVIQLVGGAGFVIFILSAIAGPPAMGLSTAEGHDPHRLVPNMSRSATIVVRLYLAYNLFGIIALRLAGMNWFDAVNHSFTAIATAGFSTRSQSIGYWDSPAVEGVIIILMLLGSINFFIAYQVIQGKFRTAQRDGELKVMVFLLAVGSVLMFAWVTLGQFEATGKAIRVAIFEVVSAVSTCGFATVGYTPFPQVGWILLTILMLVGGNTGSTAGAIKQVRIYILWTAAKWEITSAFLPANAVNRPKVWYGDESRMLDEKTIRNAALYVIIYVSILLVGTMIISGFGYDIGQSLFEFASAMGTVGLSVGVTSPGTPIGVLWVLITGMLVGRLEFFALVIGLIKLVKDGFTLYQPATN